MLKTFAGAARASGFVRLYMVPGMQHCGQGPGTDEFGENGPSSASGPEDARHDIRLALRAWVERGVAPSTLIAAKFGGAGTAGKTLMTRSLCPYPLAAEYRGSGNPDEADSFVCAREK